MDKEQSENILINDSRKLNGYNLLILRLSRSIPDSITLSYKTCKDNNVKHTNMKKKKDNKFILLTVYNILFNFLIFYFL